MEADKGTRKSKSMPKGEPSAKAVQAKAANEEKAKQLKQVEANLLVNPVQLLLKPVASSSKVTIPGSGQGNGPVGGVAAAIPMSPLIEAIRKQLEFYFGDPNLRRDKHMQGLIAKHSKGYIELKTIVVFKKVQEFFSVANIQSYEEKISTLRAAVKTSSLLKMCKRQLMIKRAVPFQLEAAKEPGFQEELDKRVVYVENLPSNCTQEAVADIFKAYGTILYVALPRTATKSADSKSKVSKCKGYAFVEFASAQSAESALAVNNSIPERFINGAVNEPIHPLSVVSKHRWNELKQQFKVLSKRAPAPRDMDVEEENGIPSSSGLQSGCLVRVKNVPLSDFSKADFKVSLLHHTDQVKFIDYQPGKPEAIIRFASEAAKDEALKKLGTELPMKGVRLAVEGLSSGEEAEYFKKVEKKRELLRAQKQQKRRKSSHKGSVASSGRKARRDVNKGVRSSSGLGV